MNAHTPYTKQHTPNGLNVTFIAPNGARVLCKSWKRTLDTFSSDIIMQLIFNDPMITGGK